MRKTLATREKNSCLACQSSGSNLTPDIVLYTTRVSANEQIIKIVGRKMCLVTSNGSSSSSGTR